MVPIASLKYVTGIIVSLLTIILAYVTINTGAGAQHLLMFIAI